MDLQEKYDELDNIISTLNVLVEEIEDKEYIEQLREIKYQAENEMGKVETELQEMRNREEAEQEREYWKEAI